MIISYWSFIPFSVLKSWYPIKVCWINECIQPQIIILVCHGNIPKGKSLGCVGVGGSHSGWPQTCVASPLCSLPPLKAMSAKLLLFVYFGRDLIPDTMSPGVFPWMVIKGPTWLPNSKKDDSPLRKLLNSKERIFYDRMIERARLIGRQKNAAALFFTLSF